jgi:hypothetical protein
MPNWVIFRIHSTSDVSLFLKTERLWQIGCAGDLLGIMKIGRKRNKAIDS